MMRAELGKGPLHWPESEPETPYDRAGRAWEQRVGSARAQVRGWQRAAAVAAALAVVFAVATVVLAVRNDIEPIIVRVGDHGGVTDVYRGVGGHDGTPREPEVRYFIADLVRKLRSLPLDPVLAKENWRSAYAYLTQEAAVKMNQLANAENPLGQLGEATVQVRVLSVVPMSGDGEPDASAGDARTYQVRWEERRHSAKGAALGPTQRFTGFFTVRIRPPTDEAAIFANPLGLFVAAFEWSQDVGAQ